MTKSFEKWSEQEVIEVFGLIKNKSMQLLQDWIRIEGEEIAVEKRNRLEELRVLLEDFANAFNEEDIKFHFISQLIGLIQFITPQYRPFLETTITTTKNDIHNTICFWVDQFFSLSIFSKIFSESSKENFYFSFWH